MYWMSHLDDSCCTHAYVDILWTKPKLVVGDFKPYQFIWSTRQCVTLHKSFEKTLKIINKVKLLCPGHLSVLCIFTMNNYSDQILQIFPQKRHHWSICLAFLQKRLESS